MRRLAIAVVVVIVVVVLGGWFVVHRALYPEMVRSTLEQQLAERLGQPVHIGSAAASIFPAPGVDLHDVAIGSPASVTLQRVSLHTGLRALLSRRIAHAEIVISGGRIPFPLPFSVASRSSAPIAPRSSPLEIDSIDRISLQDVTIVTGFPPVTVDLDASLRGDRLAVDRLTAKAGGTELRASGAFDSVSALRGKFDVTGNVEFAGYEAKDLAAAVAIAPERLALSPLSFGMFGGAFKGGLTAALGGGAAGRGRAPDPPRLELTGDVSGMDVPSLLARTGASGGITGTLGGHVALTAAGTTGDALLRSARGRIDARIANGTLPHMDLVRRVVLAFGKPSGAPPEGSGSAFSTLGGPLTLANGVLSSDKLALDSRDVDVAARGELRLPSGVVEAKGDVLLSKELTAQAGTDLRRYAGENGRVVVPVTVSGELSSPTVFVDVAAAAKRAIDNELKRRTGDLLKGLFKKKKGGGGPP